MDIERRHFFKHVARRTINVAVQELSEQVTAHAHHWIRPPYAIAELEFLLACTRCDACINACPYNIVFPLPASTGPTAMATPAMDLLNHGCHLCHNWPCVTACESGALEYDPTADEPALPILASVQINSSRCLPYLGPECGACADACPVPGAMSWQMAKPVIQADICPGCGLCREACVLEPKAISISAGT